jgi:hypothetical protein
LAEAAGFLGKLYQGLARAEVKRNGRDLAQSFLREIRRPLERHDRVMGNIGCA